MRYLHSPGLLALFIALFIFPLQAESLPRARLQIGLYIVQAEIANTPESRTLGLMQRTELKKNEGMLFIFERADVQAMWMRNTPLPLSVAFIDERGVILNIADMQPLTDATHPSAGRAGYALEMNSGWFREHGVKAGAMIKGLPANGH